MEKPEDSIVIIRNNEMDNVEIYTNLFIRTMSEIESLEEFYEHSKETENELTRELDSKYKTGLKIAELFNSVLEKKGKEEKNNRINEIKDMMITETQKLSDICTPLPLSEDSKAILFYLEKSHSHNPNESIQKYNNLNRFKKILNESVLSHIIVIFECFLTSLYRALIIQKPQKYLHDQQIPLMDILENKDCINRCIDNYIDNEMRDSLLLLSKICEKEKLEIDRYEKIQKTFTEIYYRRNAFIHTNGRANKIYMKKVDADLLRNIQENQLLYGDQNYIVNSISCLIKIVFYIIFELLQKEEINSSNFNPISLFFFGRLCKKQYHLTKNIYLALSKCDKFKFFDKTIFHVNYLISCKQTGDINTVKKELENFDVSAMQEKFVIAKNCLADNTEIVIDLLEKTYPNSFDAIAIREWPLFIEFRKTQEYQIFKNKHKDDFLIYELEENASESLIEDNNNLDDNANTDDFLDGN